jgi:hypothetical protein
VTNKVVKHQLVKPPSSDRSGVGREACIERLQKSCRALTPLGEWLPVLTEHHMAPPRWGIVSIDGRRLGLDDTVSEASSALLLRCRRPSPITESIRRPSYRLRRRKTFSGGGERIHRSWRSSLWLTTSRAAWGERVSTILTAACRLKLSPRVPNFLHVGGVLAGFNLVHCTCS